MEKAEFKTIKQFLFQENKEFVVPNYQRGYKWSVKFEDDKPSAVEKLIDDLIKANKQQEYFLQGITVAEEKEEDENRIVLIDGQQRTTTLYLLFWVLRNEDKNKTFRKLNLQYRIRKKSNEFIKKLKDVNFNYSKFDKDNEIQDVYYFKKAIEQIKIGIESITNKKAFIDFVLNKVTIIYIVIDKSKATKTFTMMNGAKATMLPEELIKAEVLRKISLPDTEEKRLTISVEENLQELREIIFKEWETNLLRNRYAREWDKWLYWWNRKDVQVFFNVDNPMGLLLEYFFKKEIKKIENKNRTFSFENFRELLNEKGNVGKQQTKLIFKELRDYQKSFEDIYNTPKIYNYLKMSLICARDKDDGFNIIEYFITKKNDIEYLKNYAKWRLVNATHSEIVYNDETILKEKAEEMMMRLKDNFVYEQAYDLAVKQFLRLNVEEENKLFEGKGRKFNFKIYGKKSLEHIHPKSKVFISNIQEGTEPLYFYGDNEKIEEKKNDNEWIDRSLFEDEGSEHCIGNLVLLDKSENSKFNNKSFEEKKKIYFNINECFTSRNLLHSISVFSKSKWGIEEILENKKMIIKRIAEDYNIND